MTITIGWSQWWPTKLMSITDSMDMSLSKLREVVKDREAWHAAIHGVTKSRTRLNDWPTMKRKHVLYLCSSKHSHAHSLLLASTISMLCVSFITYTCQKHTHTKTHFWFWHIFVFLFPSHAIEICGNLGSSIRAGH